MTTKNIRAASAAKEMAAALAEESTVTVAAPVVAIATQGVISRGKLYEMLKVAIATGVGLVLGAGVMYVYLRSYSNIGKEINAVAQSVNSLKG